MNNDARPGAASDGCGTEQERRPPAPPRLAIVTVTYNSAEVLPGFLASLEKQQFDDWVLVVIDNASGDEGATRLMHWGDARLRLIRNPDNRGFAAATNQGINWALDNGAAWVLILNNDTEFDADFLKRLMTRSDRGDARVLAPRVVYADRPALTWYAGGRFSNAWGFRATHDGEGEELPATAPSEKRVDFAPGCCKLVDARLFQELGAYDERFFVYWEDTDLCWRWKLAGVSILYVREPVIRHKASALTGGSQSPFSIRMYHRNYVLFLRKHFSSASAVARTALMSAKIAARLLLRRDSLAEARLRMASTISGWQDKN